MPRDWLAGFARWRRRRQDQKRKREQYRGLSVPERLDYATTEQEVRDIVIDYNHEIVRAAFTGGGSKSGEPLLDPEDVLKEWRERRGNLT
jgi:hypothetical protein